MGWAWFLGTLAPVIGLVQVGGATMADRYSYLPSIGVFIAVAFGLYRAPGGGRFFPWVAALPLLACVGLTEKQLGYWRDSETLFRHTLAITRNNEFAHLNLAVALDQQGRLAEALPEYREASRLNPLHYHVYYATGELLARMGRPAEALAEYRQCLRLAPELPEVHIAAGRALAALGELAAAGSEFATAEPLAPDFAQPYLELARIHFQHGLDRQAGDELRAAVRAQPEDWPTLCTVAHYLAANTNDAARNGELAVVLALEANGLSGGRQPEVLEVLGMAFAATGQLSNAVICAQHARELRQPPNPLKR